MNRIKILFVYSFLILLPMISQAQDWLYAVRPGDTLWDLCLEYTNRASCWQEIGRANNVQYERQIPPGTVIKFPIEWLKTVPDPVTITFFRGVVNYRKFSSPELSVAVAGDKLTIGTIIIVGEESSATLRFADGSILILEENSELELNALSANGATGMVDSRLRLKKGSATTRVPERETNKIRFQIETPGAVAAVRGTNFRVSAKIDDDNVEVLQSEVIEGAVDVASSVDNQLVNRGFGIIVNRDQPAPPPIQLLSAPEWKDTLDIQMVNLRSEWLAVEGAITYKLDLLSDTESADLIDSHILTTTNFEWSNLREQCYRISVSAIDRQTLHGLPAIKRVCIEALFAGPDVNDKIKMVDDKILRMSWQKVDRAESYEIELATDAEFKNVVTMLETSSTTVDIPVSEKSKYFARVRGVNSAGARSLPGKVGEWSPSQWDKKLSLIVTFFIIVGML
ncbi:FecR family protein [Aurantivibrio infirmus]